MAKKIEIKESLCKMIKKTAENSVGRSMPWYVHEPKVPECLKNNYKK